MAKKLTFPESVC